MRKVVVGLLGLSLTAGMGISLSSAGTAAGPAATPAAPMSAASPAGAVPAAAPAAPVRAAVPADAPEALSAHDAAPSDELLHPLEVKRRAARERAVSDVVSGRATPQTINGSQVLKVGTDTAGTDNSSRRAGERQHRDRYVELARARADRIFVILAEFGDERHPDFPDRDTKPTTPGPTRFDGPLHNAIPEPDRAIDNSTVWQPDYSPAHYRQLYFGTGKGVESVKTYFQTQSSGRYSVDGEVTDWVKVKYNEARYGRSGDNPTDANGDDPAVCAANTCPNSWELVKDAAAQWVADRKAAGLSDAAIAAEMRDFDQWDRYDFDGDGDFNEPDNYIDHFQIVHAGGDEADGDPWQGEDALWSHRSYAYLTSSGVTGPANNLRGGTEIGQTGLWIGDYTMQPENGGLSVFAHEYGHDLGLPDDYNRSANVDNSNEFWTLMAQSRLGAKTDAGVGERAGDLGAWNKLQLGWLDYETVVAGQQRTLDLGPEEYNTAKPQAVVVVLPDKEVRRPHGAPFAGAKQYFSGNEDNTATAMTRSFDLTGASAAELSLKARYDIEEGYDYLYVEASTDGQTWTPLNGVVGGEPFSTDALDRPAVDGRTGGAWVDMAVPLTAYAGQNVQVRLAYRTDLGTAWGGFFADAITVTADGTEVFSDGAEGESDWALDGFSVVGDTAIELFDHYYIAGHRSYVSYDRYLKTGPYIRGHVNTDRPKWVDHYPYQEGLLISYWDTSYEDNDTVAHPGQGRNLYIDSRPKPIYNLTGEAWRARIQVYDAPFSLEKADSFTLHIDGEPNHIRGQAAQPLFDDTKKYWYEELPNHGVKLPNVGVKIRVLERDGTAMKIRIS